MQYLCFPLSHCYVLQCILLGPYHIGAGLKNEFTTKKHQEILETLERFINSSDYRLTYKHLNKDILDDIG